MGIPARELHFIGATRYRVRNSAKEGDSAYRPRSFRPNKTDWPMIPCLLRVMNADYLALGQMHRHLKALKTPLQTETVVESRKG